MNAESSPSPRWGPRDLAAPIAIALPTLLLVGVGELPVLPALLVLAAGIVASEFLRGLAHPVARELWLLPALGAVGAAIGLAPVTLLSEVGAAGSALALLFALSFGSRGSRVPRGRLSGLLLPGTSVALAVIVTLVLPEGPALVGVASALLVGALLTLAALFALRSDPSQAHPQA